MIRDRLVFRGTIVARRLTAEERVRRDAGLPVLPDAPPRPRRRLLWLLWAVVLGVPFGLVLLARLAR